MPRLHLRVQSLESRDVPNGTQLFAVAEDGGHSRVAVYRAAGEEAVVNPGGPSHIAQRGELLTTFIPFEGFGGGVRIAVGDLTGDGVDDLVCGAGLGGGPHVKIYDGSALLNGQVALFDEFFAFDKTFRGGVFLAVGQRNDGFPIQTLVVGAGEGGGPHVKVYTREFWLTTGVPPQPTGLPQFKLTNEFFAYDASFRGGVRVAIADVNGDTRGDVVTGAGPGGGPHVRVWDVPAPNPLALPPYTHAVIDEFMAYDINFKGGVYVAAGHVTGDPLHAEIATGAGAGGGPHLKVYANETTGRMQTIAETFVGSPALTTGVRVGMADLSNGTAESFSIYVGRGFDPAEANIPETEPRLRGYSFHLGSFALMALDLPKPFTDRSYDPLNVGE